LPSRSSIQGPSTTLVLAPSTSAPFDYVVTIVMENHPLQGVGGLLHNASYWQSLLNQGAWSTRFHDASGSGSLPNYLAMTGGAAPCRDLSPDRNALIHCNVDARNIVDLLDAAGKTWRGYFEDYVPCNISWNNQTFCMLNNTRSSQACNVAKFSSGYLANHNPFLYYDDIVNNATRCANIRAANSQYGNWDAFQGGAYPDNLLAELNSTNPANYIFFVPTHCDGFHGPFPGWTCSLPPQLAADPQIAGKFPACNNQNISCWVGQQTQMGDLYLSQLVPNILSSRLFQTGRAVLYITFDEPNTNPTTPDYCLGDKPSSSVLPPYYCVPPSQVDGSHRATYCPDADPNPGFAGESCPIPGVWLGAPISPGDKSGLGPFSIYSSLKTVERAWNLPTLATNDKIAQPLVGFFNNFPSAPVVDFTPQPYYVDTGQTITFTPSADHGMAPITYHWDFGDGTTANTTDVASHAYARSGNYTVTLTGIDSWGQVSAKPKTRVVTDFDPFTGSLAASQSCVGVGINVGFTATASGGRLPYSYTWNYGDGSGSILGGSSTSHSFNKPYSYPVAVTIQDFKGTHKSITPRQAIDVVPYPSDCPVPTFEYSPITPRPGTNITFTGSATGGHGPYYYSWDMGDGTILTNRQTAIYKFTTGSHTITLTVSDANGIRASATKTLTVTPPPCTNGANNPPDCNNCPSGYVLTNAQCIQQQGKVGGQGGQGSSGPSHSTGVQNNMIPLVLVSIAGTAIVLVGGVGLAGYRKRP
jgi:PKD repeat protein